VLSLFVLLIKDNQEEEMPGKKGPHFSPEPLGMFVRSARRIEHILGEPLTFTAALLCVVIWLVMGPSIDRGHWQEPIWTVTSLITFLMVFLLQNTENRDFAAIHLKLDELIRAMQGANNAFVNVEALSLEELERLKQHYERLAGKAREQLGGEAQNN
jgi:low affinity Fe/Cu permease